MTHPHQIIKRLLRTEKQTAQEGLGKYFFAVTKWANKPQIKKAIEDTFKVNVLSVNTVTMRGKMRRVRYKWGRRPDWKKAVVMLKQGQKIEIK